jgi:hypothetical protein
MGKPLVATLCVLIPAVLVTCGCATTSKGPSDQELVRARVDEFWAGFTAHDIERIMACVSENFNSSWFDLNNKAALEEFLKKHLPPGTTEKEQVDTSKVIPTIQNDTATAGPFWVGESAFFLVLKKEEAVAKPAVDRKGKAGKKPKLDWFITNMAGVGAHS